MKSILMIVGAVMVVLGLAGLIQGGFSYTKDKTAVELGPIKLNVQQDERVNVSPWVSIGLTAVGAVLLVGALTRR
jgi:CheY-specific phosphatase CheX